MSPRIDTVSYKEENLSDTTSKNDKYRVLNLEFETPIKWSNAIQIGLWHAVAAYSIVYYILYLRTPGIFIYNLILYVLGGFGITAGVHRLWTHRSYKANRPLTLLLLLFFTMAGQNSVYIWARDHRTHHKHSETSADPHNAKRGFFFSHVGWLMMKKHPEVIRLGKQIDCSDLTNDPWIVFQHRYYIYLKWLFCFTLPAMIPPYLYGESWTVSILGTTVVRYILISNVSWSINSWSHLYGMKPYNKDIYPGETPIVSFLSTGEGYHNYHHTFAWDYKTSEFGKFNLATSFIDFFHRIGWAKELKSVSPEMLERVANKHGDGTWKRPKNVHQKNG